MGHFLSRETKKKKEDTLPYVLASDKTEMGELLSNAEKWEHVDVCDITGIQWREEYRTDLNEDQRLILNVVECRLAAELSLYEDFMPMIVCVFAHI